jgi:hypothetical protein
MGTGFVSPGIKFVGWNLFENRTIPLLQIRIKIPVSTKACFVLNMFFRLLSIGQASTYYHDVKPGIMFPCQHLSHGQPDGAQRRERTGNDKDALTITAQTMFPPGEVVAGIG